MSAPDTNETPLAFATRRLENDTPRQQVENELVALGQSRQFATRLVAEIVQVRNARRRSQGLTLVLVGAVICFLSCVLTVTGAVSGQAYNLVLFGLTSLGVLVILAGFTRIF